MDTLMTCDEAGPRIARFVDGQLVDAEYRSVRKHLAGCPLCRSGFYRAMARGILAAHARPAPPAPKRSPEVKSPTCPGLTG